MTRQDGPRDHEDYLRQGSPQNSTFAESFPRWACSDDVAAAATGVLLAVALPLQVGDVVTNLSFVSGATAADTPLNWGFALYSAASTPAKLAQTADQTTTAWAANTAKTVALATPQLITTPGIYYAAIWMKATAVVSLLGRSLGLAIGSTALLSQKVLAQTSGSTLTATAPATIATPTAVVGMPYCVAT